MVGKKFSTLNVASLRSPPTFSGAALAMRVCENGDGVVAVAGDRAVGWNFQVLLR